MAFRLQVKNVDIFGNFLFGLVTRWVQVMMAYPFIFQRTLIGAIPDVGVAEKFATWVVLLVLLP